jgi:hypothetical protein
MPADAGDVMAAHWFSPTGHPLRSAEVVESATRPRPANALYALLANSDGRQAGLGQDHR